MTETMAYLMGMIVGKGTIQQRENDTNFIVSIPHKAQYTDATHNVILAVQASVADIMRTIQPLLQTNINFHTGRHETKLYFTKPNNDTLVNEILRLCNGQTIWETMRIPDYFFSQATREEIKYFLRGLADVTGHARSSNHAYHSSANQHRVYIEIPKNWFLVVDICNLLKRIDVPVQNIDWAHPNIRDGKLTKYNKGNRNFWKKEHQIKIFANEFLTVGFNIIHKNQGLQELSNQLIATYLAQHNNRDPRLLTHRFYWEVPQRQQTKPYHPGEDDIFIPTIIRGRHFNSWREIASSLGYRR